MTITQGDARLVWGLYTYRYLTSGQLARRYARSTPVIRRRMRRLKPEGYVVSLQRQPADEAAYTLGPEGLAFIAHELGCPVSQLPWPRTSASRGFFWKHHAAVNDVRISFDLSTESSTSPVSIRRTIPEWEINPSARRTAPVLFERFRSPDGSAYWHRPDCLFLMYPKTVDRPMDVAVFLELDRNTEAISSRIRAKIEGYFEYFSRARFREAFGAVAMRVLFVLDNVSDRRRVESMQEELRRFAKSKGATGEAFQRCFRFALMREINETSVITQPIWHTADDEPRLFFVQPVRESPRASSTEVTA